MKIKFVAGIIALLGAVHVGTAGVKLELQSAYLGDGWFQYRLAKPNTPTFWSIDPAALAIPFTNRVEYGPDPQGWTNVLIQPPNFAQWNYALATYAPSQLGYGDFLVRSAEHTFRTTTNGLAVISMYLGSQWFVYPMGGGYVLLPTLTPCAPSLADASTTNLTSSVDFGVDDVTVDGLVITNNSVQGIVFTWFKKSTVLLQGSPDALHWTNVTLIWGNPGTTVWTTNQSLNNFGNFFRLELVAVDQYLTNLPSLPARTLTPAASESAATTPSLTYRPQGDEVAVQFVSEKGREYAIEASDRLGKIAAIQTVLGTGKAIEVRFNTELLPNPVFFSAKPGP